MATPQKGDDMKTKRKSVSKRYPPTLPCGCVAIRDFGKNAAQLEVLLLEDGVRLCKHSQRWRLVWEEVK